MSIPSKFYIRLEGKEVFTMKIKEPDNSRKGDYDIFIDAGKGLCFKRTIAGNYFRVFDVDIGSISWHGFYMYKRDKNKGSEYVEKPLLRFKPKVGKGYELRHFGSINPREKIPFPICSIYVPKEMNVSGLKGCNVSEDSNLVIDIDDLTSSLNARVDIFVFGKEVDVKKFRESYASFVFEKQSVDAFNGDGTLFEPEAGLEASYHNIKKGDTNVLVRKISNPRDMFVSSCHDFSIVFHDPNDTYNLINRGIVLCDDNGKAFYKGSMKHLHETEMK